MPPSRCPRCRHTRIGKRGRCQCRCGALLLLVKVMVVVVLIMCVCVWLLLLLPVRAGGLLPRAGARRQTALSATTAAIRQGSAAG